MPVNVMSALQEALRQLEGEKSKLERQILAVRGALDGMGGPGRGRAPAGPRRPARRGGGMSAEARRAASQRMKAYWAKRRRAAPAKPAKAPAQAAKKEK